jgi:hypothetical protein
MLPYVRNVLKDFWLEAAVHFILKDYENVLKALINVESEQDLLKSRASFDPSFYSLCTHVSGLRQVSDNCFSRFTFISAPVLSIS